MSDSPIRVKSVEAFRCRVNLATLQDYLNAIEALVFNHAHAYVFNYNLHSLYLYFRYASIQRLYQNATMVIIDGMPIVWLLKLAGIPAKRQHRLTAVDYIWPLLEH